MAPQKTKIWLSSPHMGGKEMEYIKEAFDSNWVAPLGPNVDGFEQDLNAFLGPDVYTGVFTSGTASIHLGLILLGVQTGDEVICQSFTFSASANPIMYLGGIPVFVDSEEDTWNMSPEYLEEAIKDRLAKGKKPKAIIPVHLYGMPARMKEILAIAAHYEIPVLEDAAEALGSSIDGRKCGTFGAVAALSFNGNKVITTSGGGALVSTDNSKITAARFLSTQARDTAPYYQHTHIGYNYRMSNICAGIGRGQMEVLPERILQRRRVFEQYRNKLEGRKGVKLTIEPDGFFSNRWLTTILIDPDKSSSTCEELTEAFKAENIECRPLWKPMHMQPIFASQPYYGNKVSEHLFKQGLCLPSGSNLTEEDMNRIFSILDCLLKR